MEEGEVADDELRFVAVEVVGGVEVMVMSASWVVGGETRPLMAGGGSSKAICSDASCFEPSWPWMSVDDAGVGGNVPRGIVLRV